MGKDRDALESKLEAFVEELRQSSIIVQDYQQDSKDLLISKLYSTFTDLLGNINALSQKVKDVVPQGLLEVIDRGENPNIYLKKAAESVANHTMQTSGKIEAYEELHQQLSAAMREIISEEEESSLVKKMASLREKESAKMTD